MTDCMKGTQKQTQSKARTPKAYRPPLMPDLLEQYLKLPQVRKARREAIKKERNNY